MKNFTRRSFIKQTAVGAAALGFPFIARSQESASEEIHVAVVGFHGRGKDHIDAYSKMKGCRITALCDVDKSVLNTQHKRLTGNGATIEPFTDIRKVLESKNVDVVSIATPNHWHALAAIWAIQAGKDVYLEKPVSHNVWEGRKIVEAARKYGKIVQTGTQSRSSHGIAECFKWLKDGNLGKIKLARGLCYKSRPGIGKTTGPQKPPESINYDLWCGPAPLVPPRRNTPKFGTVHYDWHWFWDYGSGDLGNQGIHQMDIARWALGEDALSPAVLSLGGRLGYEDDGETPNTQIVWHDYKAAPLCFEVRGLPAKTGDKNMDSLGHPAKGPWMVKDEKSGEQKEIRAGVAVIIECEGGYAVVPNYNEVHAFDKDGAHIRSFKGTSDHFANFIKAVRSRKHTDLNADILEGHLSSALCHTGNISYRLGKQQAPGEIRDAIKANSGLSEAFGRMVEHLKANEVDLDVTKASLGVALKMDPKTERFIGNDKANAMLTRDYRKPYVVPEKV